MTTIKHAINLATRLHDKTYRKAMGLPYIAHPARIAAHLHEIYERDYQDSRSRWSFNEIIMAGWCHDVLEDTDVNQEELKYELGYRAFNLVWGMTNIKYDVNNRIQQKFLDRQRLREEADDVCVIKLVDRLDNVQDMDGLDRDFRTLYAIESMALIDAILASTNHKVWHWRTIQNLGKRIESIVGKYLPKAIKKEDKQEIPNDPETR